MLVEPTPVVAPITAGPRRVVTCPTCAGSADVHSPHVIIDASGIRIFCSTLCKQRAIEGDPEPEPARVLPPPRRSPFVVGGLVVGCLFVTDSRAVEAPPPVAFVPPPPIILVSPPPPPEPTAEELLRAQWTAELIQDAWVHPLNGPSRRMPIRDSRVFGAERPGERPIECQNGHCGVDIGGEVWGEPVLAAHDGVVDRVQRGPNDERGGLYVRIAHRGGTVFTQYFHLAAIPRWLEVGDTVQAGEVIGLLGDTGVKASGAHLHFTISIRPAPDEAERYIDPEPLIALWPIHIPAREGGGKLSAATEPPGAVIGARNRKRVARARPAPTAIERAPDTVVDETAPDSPAPTL
jgi:murein DD-endopeptidase MepM/ murein hydrolase activator NlpD